MRFLSVCSGIEAASVAWEPLGWRAVGFSEIEPFPCAVLAHHYGSNMPGEPLARNGVPNHGDFTALIGDPPACDLLVGGTPCQAFSVAGQRLSLKDARGNLTLQFVRLAHAIRSLRWVVWENVPGVLSTDDNAFGCFLGGLVGADDALLPCEPPLCGRSNAFWRWREAGRWPALDDDGVETGEFHERAEGHVVRWPDAGMVAGPWGRAAWRVLDAQHFGLAQRRRRVFVVASSGGRGDPAAVLFEPRGVRGDSAPGGEAGEGVAGPSGGGDHGAGAVVIAGAVTSKWAKGSGVPAGDECYNLVTHALRGEGFDASEDGTGRGTPLVPVHEKRVVAFPANMSGTQRAPTEDVSPALATKNPTAVAFALRGREGGAQIEVTGETTGALRAAAGGSSRDYVAFSAKDHGADAGPLAPTLRADGHAASHANGGVPPGIAGGGAVRRLTPRECERLQGFPDDYTAIPLRGKPAEACPDGPRYRALGNSMAVPVMRWIGQRIAMVEAQGPEAAP